MSHIRIKSYRKRDGTLVKKYELLYYDQHKKRHSKLYGTRRAADVERIRIESEVYGRCHVASNASRTVIAGLRAWFTYMEGLERNGKRERSTVDRYKSHIECHIAKTDLAPLVLSDLTSANIQDFVEYLESNLSTAMARKVFQTLKMGLKYCRKHQWLHYAPTEDFRIVDRDRESDGKVKIPSKKDIKDLLKAADEDVTGINGAIVRVLGFCGLRPSEMRGLPRTRVFIDEDIPYLEIAQRADIYGKIGKPKSRAGYRKIPIGPDTVMAIKKAMLARKAGSYNLVFPNPDGGVMSYYNFIHRRWAQLMKRAGLAKAEIAKCKSKPEKKVEKVTTNFTPYALRHVAASQWIEMGLLPKRIQELMGHNSLKMTMDTYGHLWTNPEADKEIAIRTERAFA